MQLPETSNIGTTNVVRLADGARRIRVLYAGDMEFAKAQFASVAPQLHLVPLSAMFGGDAPLAPGEGVDAALIDSGAPGIDAHALVDQIRGEALDIPIVLALDPAAADQSPARIAGDLRVDDYTVKMPGWLGRLASRLELAIAHHRRRQSLDALQAASDRLRAIVESAPVCLARVAGDGTILAMNGAAMTMMGAEAPEDLLGKSFVSFVDENGTEAMREFIGTVSAGQPGSLEIDMANAGGIARTVDVRAVPLARDAQGRSSALLVLRDATERKRLEASMIANAAASPAAIVERDEREHLRTLLDAAREECRRMEMERDAIRRGIEDAHARSLDADELRAARTAAERQLEELHQRCEQVTGERAALAQQLEEARARYETALAEHETARQQYDERCQLAEAERASVSARCDALETLIETIEARHAAEVLELKAARAEAEAELRNVEDSDRPLAAELDALQASLSVLRGQYDEMSAALHAAEARHTASQGDQNATTASLEARLHEAEGAREALAADHAATRQVLARRVEELEGRLHEAVAEREALRHRLDERDAEYAQLSSQHTALQAAPPSRDLHDAQTAFREAFQFVADPVHMEPAADTAAYARLEQRLQEAEAACERLAAQRDERDSVARALETEVEQLLELRRLQRQELVRALQESDESEQLASTRLAQCVRLRQMLNEAQAALQRLSEFAAHQSTRLSAPLDGSGDRLLPDVEAPATAPAPAPRLYRRGNGTSAAPMEASWS